MYLSRREWKLLNRTSTGHDRCGDMITSGAPESPSCCCGNPHQTIVHIIEKYPALSSGQFYLKDIHNVKNGALVWQKQLEIIGSHFCINKIIPRCRRDIQTITIKLRKS